MIAVMLALLVGLTALMSAAHHIQHHLEHTNTSDCAVCVQLDTCIREMRFGQAALLLGVASWLLLYAIQKNTAQQHLAETTTPITLKVELTC